MYYDLTCFMHLVLYAEIYFVCTFIVFVVMPPHCLVIFFTIFFIVISGKPPMLGLSGFICFFDKHNHAIYKCTPHRILVQNSSFIVLLYVSFFKEKVGGIHVHL
jgi:hypothetical protein